MILRAPQMLRCTPPTEHVVTFLFHFLRVNNENLYTVIMKQSDIFVLDNCESTVDKTLYSEPHVMWIYTNWQRQKLLRCAPLSLGKWNAMWLFDIFPQLKHWSSNYMRHEIYFTLKVVVKRKEWSHSFVLRAAIWAGVYTAIVMPHQRVPKQHSLFECAKLINTIWKLTFVSYQK